jgi:alkanesulfonate monooxygenase
MSQIPVEQGTSLDNRPLSNIEVYSTSPQSKDWDASEYLQQTIDVARWSEEVGCRGILVYTDNGIVDPWLVSQVIIQNTKTLWPLVAIQPIYMHPYWVAKKITTLAFLHKRKVALNMLAGGFALDLAALGDQTPHDRRYDRMVEYTLIIKRLLAGETVTFQGEFYQVDKLALKPALPAQLFPAILASGSSGAGLQAARAIGATAVQYPGPPAEFRPPAEPGSYGVRLGIVARESADTAWEIAHARFPSDRKGEMTHQLAMKVSDSHWHKQLSARPEDEGRTTYWLGPFQHNKTNCPYLVGNYGEVSAHLSQYMAAGFHTYILDIPPNREELNHIGIVFQEASKKAA